MNTQEIRRKFLHYFKQKNHAVISSSPVIPHDDPTLLFTNAGMNQFKDVFLGKSARDYKRAVTSQKCIRAGGKHNDLDNVGHTSRHLTFFEMLGNFSFGDYFKKEAIQFAWEISTEIFGFEPDRIWPTVFHEDDEAFELWTHYVPANRITRFGEKDNFWAMGDTGPCGPCSELLYDRGSSYGAARNPTEDSATGERFLEFWNLVFMQFNRNAAGIMEPLPKPSIDTGSGLERIVGLKMGVKTLFETDILRGLIAQVEQVAHAHYDPRDLRKAPAFHVIADHLRCLAFAIADGAQPSNVDRGYVLRKILRRTVRYSRILGLDKPFLADVLPRLIDSMGEDYPELKKSESKIAEILTAEEESFIRTLRRGGNILGQIIEHAQGHNRMITGDEAFKLKDTYGLPLDEILLLAKDNNLSVDLDRYQALELEAKERSRKTQKVTQQIAGQNIFSDYIEKHPPTEFVGYVQHSVDAKIVAIVINDAFATEIQAGEEGIIILDKTPFYPEMGGQVGDNGILEGRGWIFTVTDTHAPYKGVIAHVGKVDKGCIRVGDSSKATVDSVRRQKIANNHTATHLLHWALQIILGEHIKQAGSVVDADRLRFDFNHHKGLSLEEIRGIENAVNAKIRENFPVKWYELSYEEVQKRTDIKQFFGDKYGAQVRVVDIEYSKELCGGTHTGAVGNIGLFRIVKESSIAAGVRRIEAVTGEEAEAFSRQSEDLLEKLGSLLKAQPAKLVERVEKVLEENKEYVRELKILKKEQMAILVKQLVEKKEIIRGIPAVIAEVSMAAEELRDGIEQIMVALKSGIVILGTSGEDRCSLIARVSDDLVAKGIKAIDIIKVIAPIVDGSGGGKANQAQAGGKAPYKLGEALAKSRELL